MELIYYVLWGIGLLFSLCYLAGIFRVIYYEYRINKEYKKQQNELDELIKQPVSTAYIRGKSGKIVDNHKKRIDYYERKRRFVLDKLPLIRK